MENYEVILIRPESMKEKLRKGTKFIPLGILYLGEVLIEKGYKVHLIDEDNETAIKKISKIVSSKTLCFGLSTMSGMQLKNAVEIAEILKNKYKDIPLVWGGVHVTALPEQTLQDELVDYIVWGEGENTFPLLLEAIKNKNINSLTNCSGIGFKRNGSLTIGENSGYTSLDRVFDLPYHLLDMDKYLRPMIEIGSKQSSCTWTTRGCPFRCRFCSNSSSVWPNTVVRQYSIEHIVNDIQILVKKYNTDMVYIGDECPLIYPDKLISILETVKKMGINIKYRLATRVDLVLKLGEERLKILKELGVIGLGVGIESGSQRVLNNMKKNITVEEIYKVDNLLTEYKIFKGYNFLIGTPGETKEDLKATLELILHIVETSLYCPYPLGGTLHLYIPLPGTEMYEEAIDCGFKEPKSLRDWVHFDFTDVEGSRNIVRPWISDEYMNYINQAVKIVHDLNFSMKGKGTDLIKIKKIKSDLIKIIKEN